MAKAVMVVFSRPLDPSREDEYNEWYDNTHVREICEIPGVVSARRFHLSAAQSRPVDPSTHEYLAIYELEADDIQTVLDEMRARGAAGKMTSSDTIQRDPPTMNYVYEQR